MNGQNIFPFPPINIPGQSELSSILQQTFEQIQLNGQNLISQTVGASQIVPNSLGTGQISAVISNNNTNLVYTGTWDTGSASSSSSPTGTVGGYNGNYSYSATAGNTIYYQGSVSQFSVIAIQSPTAGQITVSIDGGLPQTVDTYSATTQTATVFTQSMGLSTHSIKITVLGTHNSASTGSNFYFVAIF